jgi:ferredoxin
VTAVRESASGDPDERVIHDLRIRIDRSLCVGFGDCVTAAPDAFRLDAESIVIFVDPERVARERLLAACDACPVDAITVWAADGRQIVP